MSYEKSKDKDVYDISDFINIESNDVQDVQDEKDAIVFHAAQAPKATDKSTNTINSYIIPLTSEKYFSILNDFKLYSHVDKLLLNYFICNFRPTNIYNSDYITEKNIENYKVYIFFSSKKHSPAYFFSWIHPSEYKKYSFKYLHKVISVRRKELFEFKHTKTLNRHFIAQILLNAGVDLNVVNLGFLGHESYNISHYIKGAKLEFLFVCINTLIKNEEYIKLVHKLLK